MNVLFAASECAPYAKVGGLGDVIAALPKELVLQGVSVDVVLPLYDHLVKEKMDQYIVDQTGLGNRFVVHFMGKEESCRLFSLAIPNTTVRLFLIQNDTYLSNGQIYLSPSAFAEGDDEMLRFMFFSKAVFTLMERGVFVYDVVHAHDYHTSYLLYLIKNEKALGKRPRLVLSIHNSGNQGLITNETINIEINGKTLEHNLLGMGIASADVVVPVSENYAKELVSGEFGFGLEHVMRAFSEKLHGIVNGIDSDLYNPRLDTLIPEKYNENLFENGKSAAKKTVFNEAGWEHSEGQFLVSFVGRLVDQKNIRLMDDSIRIILRNVKNREFMKFVFLGVGEEKYEEALQNLADAYPENVKFFKIFHEELAHKIFAGSDLFLIPSVFEPCGLTQLFAMRYGALPLATPVGGLVDTISDVPETQTGFFIHTVDPNFLSVNILDLYTVWKNAKDMWDGIIKNGMTRDFSWTESAKKYMQLYQG
jgi:starch synthase